MDKISQKTGFDLEHFFDIAPDLLCILGFDGYFKKVNRSVCKALGYSAEELLAEPIESFVFPEDMDNTSFATKALMQGRSLLNFENRFVAKDRSIVWLCWTSVPIKRDQLIFAIARNITYSKQLEEYDRISSILDMINNDHHHRFKKHVGSAPAIGPAAATGKRKVITDEPSNADHFWLNSFEAIVRNNAGKVELSLSLISDGLALSQRQLFRRVDNILGITPNKLVRVIRLQLAWEAIASGKFRTIKEISNIAGYSSRGHFSKLFREVYGINVSELL